MKAQTTLDALLLILGFIGFLIIILLIGIMLNPASTGQVIATTGGNSCGNGICDEEESICNCDIDCHQTGKICCNAQILNGDCCNTQDCATRYECQQNNCVAIEPVNLEMNTTLTKEYITYNEETEIRLTVYNPSKQKKTLKINTIKITNAQGKEQANWIVNNIDTLDIPAFANNNTIIKIKSQQTISGYYTVNIETSEGILQTRLGVGDTTTQGTYITTEQAEIQKIQPCGQSLIILTKKPETLTEKGQATLALQFCNTEETSEYVTLQFTGENYEAYGLEKFGNCTKSLTILPRTSTQTNPLTCDTELYSDCYGKVRVGLTTPQTETTQTQATQKSYWLFPIENYCLIKPENAYIKEISFLAEEIPKIKMNIQNRFGDRAVNWETKARDIGCKERIWEGEQLDEWTCEGQIIDNALNCKQQNNQIIITKKFATPLNTNLYNRLKLDITGSYGLIIQQTQEQVNTVYETKNIKLTNENTQQIQIIITKQDIQLEDYIKIKKIELDCVHCEGLQQLKENTNIQATCELNRGEYPYSYYPGNGQITGIITAENDYEGDNILINNQNIPLIEFINVSAANLNNNKDDKYNVIYSFNIINKGDIEKQVKYILTGRRIEKTQDTTTTEYKICEGTASAPIGATTVNCALDTTLTTIKSETIQRQESTLTLKIITDHQTAQAYKQGETITKNQNEYIIPKYYEVTIVGFDTLRR